eukprot:TRINITY_DN7133_c2_g1_i1.p1 TRINITY_DN7133_c2_g1~~TRINITY_DN7133_c2_g1_i1.p1  ORF type:complete len:100 (+),score=27.60 TRINITY_DN7133_c2_g1_i1:187-486(+)
MTEKQQQQQEGSDLGGVRPRSYSGSPLGTVIQKVEESWGSIKQHYNEFPFVWASYFVVLGGLGIYSARAWREMRRAENRLMTLQNELKRLQDRISNEST